MLWAFQGYYLTHQERRVQRFHEVLNDYVNNDNVNSENK